VKRSDASHLSCSIARSLDVLGEWWTLLVLREAFFGRRRFEHFVEDLGISRGILTDRLATLVEHGILERHRYQEKPDRFEYRLTDAGRDLFDTMMALMQWGDRWISPKHGGPPVVIRHNACGGDISGPRRCGTCSAEITVRDVTIEPGPGYGREAALASAPSSHT
jgi:DNA-binding HxlR family transcriptional regulator